MKHVFGDFCQDPSTTVLSLIHSEYIKQLLLYYATCTAANASSVDTPNPLYISYNLTKFYVGLANQTITNSYLPSNSNIFDKHASESCVNNLQQNVSSVQASYP
jgi:hypothetical protein